MQTEDRNVMRFGHAFFCVFVSENDSSAGVERSVVVGVIEVPVGVNDAFHRRVAQAIESLFEPRPCRRNESIRDEFAVGAVEDDHASPRAGQHSDIVSKLLRLEGSGVELGAHIRKQVGSRRR